MTEAVARGTTRDATGEPARERPGRWAEFLDTLIGLIPADATRVAVDGDGPYPALLADRLAGAMTAAGRPCARVTGGGAADPGCPDTITLADPPAVRTPPAEGGDIVVRLSARPRGGMADETGRAGADIVVDLRDPAWPLIRHVARRLAGRDHWYVTESRAFFAARAMTWDTKFGDDIPAYAAAVAEAGIQTGATVLDAGCGTGRALPALASAVGPTGAVVGLDLTPQMLAVAKEKGRAEHAALVLADASRLPLARGSVDAVFAAGLVTHLPDLAAGLGELARVTRPGGLLVIFHPSGRAALAARHGRSLRPDEPLAEHRLGALLATSGWRLTGYDDPPHRFFALAARDARNGIP